MKLTIQALLFLLTASTRYDLQAITRFDEYLLILLFQIDAAIVRIMKTRKNYTHTLLVSDLYTQLGFTVKVKPFFFLFSIFLLNYALASRY